MSEVSEKPTGPIVARAGSYYRNMRYLMCTVFFAFGCWAIYDGFYGGQKHNEKVRQLKAQIETAVDATTRDELNAELIRIGDEKSYNAFILPNQIIGVVLPPLAIAYVFFMRHRSRGEIRLENDTLFAPGHPPVKVSEIESIDNSLWKRKGIARVSYRQAGGESGQITLDDFIYQRDPIDAIHEKLMSHLKAETPAETPA